MQLFNSSSKREQHINIENSYSEGTKPEYGVPQSVVLDPVTQYPIPNEITKLTKFEKIICFADDTGNLGSKLINSKISKNKLSSIYKNSTYATATTVPDNPYDDRC